MEGFYFAASLKYLNRSDAGMIQNADDDDKDYYIMHDVII
jgi:hypothetical protein